MTLLTPSSVRVSSDMPAYGAGYSIAPTPMIAPWPTVSRGMECTVPMPPGLVSETVAPEWSSIVSSLRRARRTISS